MELLQDENKEAMARTLAKFGVTIRSYTEMWEKANEIR
jgi:hypothetical protein